MRIAFLPLGIALAASAAQLPAQRREQPYQAPPPTIVATPLAVAIAGFDRDGDLSVSRAEYDAGVAASLARADENRDGRVSLIELSAWAEAALGNRGALPGQFDFDRDGDDVISHAEFIALFDARFTALDRDADRQLRRSELVSHAPVPVGRPGRRAGEPEQARPPR